MRVLGGIDELPVGLKFALTIGMFDGVHRGHQRAIKRLVGAARKAGAASVVLTFDPHPAQVLRGSSPPLLCSPAEKLARLAALEVDITVLQSFDRGFAAQPPEAFLDRLRTGRQLRAIVMTGESAFGRDRVGILATIRRLGTEMSFRVVEVSRLESDGGTLSSTRLRGLIEHGRLSEVRRLLGRRYAVVGRVVEGDRRGRELGYPTANLEFPAPVALPPDGVYAVHVGWGGDNPLEPANTSDGVASLGVRPTFGGGARLLEAHLFDFAGDLYGEDLRMDFVRRLRGEKKFGSAEALIRQMDRDSQKARQVLAHHARSTTLQIDRDRPVRSKEKVPAGTRRAAGRGRQGRSAVARPSGD